MSNKYGDDFSNGKITDELDDVIGYVFCLDSIKGWLIEFIEFDSREYEVDVLSLQYEQTLEPYWSDRSAKDEILPALQRCCDEWNLG